MSWRQFESDLINVRRSLSLGAALPRFFRDRVTLQQAEEEIKRLLDTRGKRFLDLVRSEVYARPESPYVRLLKNAACELSDLEVSVNQDGLESTLANLARQGVYLTSDEFKGKTEVVRGPISFRVSPTDFEPRRASAGFVMQSSGTKNRPLDTFSPLAWRALQSNGEAIFYHTHDLFSCAHAVYEPIIAGRIHFILLNAKVGIPVNRWFALKVGAHSAAEDKFHHINARLIALMGRLFGVGISNPHSLARDDVEPIFQWILDNWSQHRSCCITTVVSNAVRLVRIAAGKGVSMQGVAFALSGEPLTPSKKLLIEKTGARIALRYGPGGGNGTALGCGNPSLIDEMHVPQTMFTLVEHPRSLDYGSQPIHPLMLTTLHATAPRFLFNVENGDYATMIKRDCGCPLQKVGFTQHIHTVRSFEKMTGEGMNYSSSDLFELLENAIPAEFGGAPGDYQLVEEEDDGGQTRLTLLVHPDLGDVNETKLLLRLSKVWPMDRKIVASSPGSGKMPALIESSEIFPMPVSGERHCRFLSSQRYEVHRLSQ